MELTNYVTKEDAKFCKLAAKQIRENIIKARKASGMGQAEAAKLLAEISGGSPCHTSIQCAERAEGLPYLKLFALARIYGCKVEDFFKLPDEISFLAIAKPEIPKETQEILQS